MKFTEAGRRVLAYPYGSGRLAEIVIPKIAF
jgi:3-hydroxy-3-methylglutaryl CoA synthase